MYSINVTYIVLYQWYNLGARRILWIGYLQYIAANFN